MIYYVKQDFPDGKYQAGNELTEAQFLEVRDTPYVDFVLELPDDARGRLNMRDATPNKPMGAAPNPADATKGSAVSSLSAKPHSYIGGQEAIGVINNPSPEDRQKDMNLDNGIGDTAPTKNV